MIYTKCKDCNSKIRNDKKQYNVIKYNYPWVDQGQDFIRGRGDWGGGGG